jgi:NTE family protein
MSGEPHEPAGDEAPVRLEGRIGLALGSGAGRGWAHVGVIRRLEEMGVVPDVVCGSSSGALVGALYVAGELDAFEAWGHGLDRRQVMGYFDLSLRGGLIKAVRLLDAVAGSLTERRIEELPRPFACVATDLASGREMWLREGGLVSSLRASMAIPGFVTPVRHADRWLVDGGLVNAVPVSLCRAMGADTVIAVDLNTTLLRRRFEEPSVPEEPTLPEPDLESDAQNDREQGTVLTAIREFAQELRQRRSSGEPAGVDPPPSIYEVMANALNIMQMRITRSRMAGDPPEVLVTPRLASFGFLDFHRAAEGIEEGRAALDRALARI